ncbi:MAG: acyl carrier protein [Lachnospiraceae bacterium]|nr:acyl carrier protein [Candidatus Minthocola equi]
MDIKVIQKVVADVLSCDPEQVTAEKSFENDLGADSLDRIEIVMSLEEALGITIPDEEAENIVTVGDAIEKIEKLLG